MERRSFLRLCGLGTCGALVGAVALPGCGGVAHVQALPEPGRLRVPLNAFMLERQGERTFRRSIIVEAPGVQAPIAVFRNGTQQHIALLMRCTHRGAELSLAGEQLTCPAHGSAFADTGAVLEGPADEPIQPFPVTYDGTDLLIHLA